MARKKAEKPEIDTGKLLQALDLRHEELLRDLEDLNLQIEQALSQLRPNEPKEEAAPEKAPPAIATATGKKRRRSTSSV